MSLILTDSRLQLETLLFLCSQERVLFQLQSIPDNSNLQGKSKKLAGVRVIGSTKQITGNGGMNASNMNTSKLDKYTVLDIVFKLD